ncbi:MAG: M42 family metallopeptidase [Candidatus Bathyarchaeota archaeon]|nr:M42 family metallopeptidase [Candidatus Bathyarchaeota archaeon]
MNKPLLERLSNAFGPPGHEAEPRNILIEELQDYADEVRTDKLGNVFFTHKGDEKAPIIMLAAHTDEVAVLITDIDDQGFLRFHPWGIVDNVLPGQRMMLKGKKGTLYGILGTKPPHVLSAEERKAAIPADELFIDIGADNREMAEKKGAYVGMTGTFDVQFKDLGDGYLWGKAFDDRVGCYVMAEVFKWAKDTSYNIIAVGTVQEEVGLRGSKTAAWQVDPDYGLALENTFAMDMPGVPAHKQSAGLHKGPVVTIADRSVIAHPKVLGSLMEAADAEDIPYQFKKIPSGGTDAGSIHLTKAGIPSGTVANPCRYIHGPCGITTEEDIENTVALVKAFIKRISS